MAGNPSLFRWGVMAALLLASLAFPDRLAAEELGEFSHEFLPDGTPRFTQMIRWNADPNVLYYEADVRTAAGEEIAVLRFEEPVLRLSLSPGEYRFRITLYNLVGRPELELPWRSMIVRKAEIPRVTGLSRNAWFLEDLKPEVALSGENLAPGATIVLENAAASEPPIYGTELERKGTSSVVVGFPVRTLAAGEYSLVITNPGGISFTLPRALSVRFQKPVDVLLSAGYAPWISLYDTWFVETWPGTFFPLSAASRFSMYFAKRPYGYFGVEASVGGRFMKGGIDTAVLRTQIVLTGVNGIYKYPFSPGFTMTGRIGGGVELSRHAFDYEGAGGSEIYSIDPYVSAGISLQFFLTKKIYLDAGADWMHVFAVGSARGGLMPFFFAGLLF
jgi:hypothetical protein